MKVYRHIAMKLQAFEDSPTEIDLKRDLEAFIAAHMPEGTELGYKFSSVVEGRFINYLEFWYLGVTCTMEMTGYKGIEFSWLSPADMTEPHQEGIQARLLNALWREV